MQANKIFVLSGQIIVPSAPSELVTVLGSCVSVCLWDRDLKIGGMNHYLLPQSRRDDRTNGGLTATKILIQSVLQVTASIKNLEAKIFGGGNPFLQKFLMVGPRNVDVAKLVLQDAKIPIVTEDTGGIAGRKISFNTQTGDVRVSVIS